MVFAIIGLIILTVLFVRYKGQNAVLLARFQQGNTITFGRKGCGKDMIFNFVINHRRRKCYSNIQFNNRLCTTQRIDELSIAPNTYANFIDGEVTKVERDEKREGKDYYLSDAGVFLPSQYNAALDKIYPSFPLYYALSRHLYNSNVHLNTQALGRPWNKLREQADSYIQALRTYNVLNIVYVTRWRLYDKYSSAEAEVRPYRASAFSSKERKARQEEHRSLYGTVIEGYSVQFRWQLHYDTRHFKHIVFDDTAATPSTPCSTKRGKKPRSPRPTTPRRARRAANR